MSRLSLAASVGLAAILLQPAQPRAAQAGTDPQLIIVSFDGAHDNALWERSLAMARRTGATFTYFLGCTFLMTRADAASYQAPGEKQGASNVGFAPDHADVRARLGHIWEAYRAGHEIGSHGCGHFDGSAWTARQWQEEFSQFDAALKRAWTVSGNGGSEPAGWQDFATTAIRGFRAPYLATGPGLFEALARHGFAYDASTVSDGPETPRLGAKPVRFSLPMIAEGPKNRPVIAMDYNFFARHSGAKERPEDAAAFRERTLKALRSALEREYQGSRQPLQIGYHFVEMNGGAYWDALDIFLEESCGKAEIACVSHAEALRRLAAGDDSPS
ncbi:polysaccharide deacetylase [Pseudohoeflea coraliihabitans]|uniref:polysaccharide deacetylase n=1 Tax=Pseudohoeflea coraliihabitans TaxID=2860393 RepID=UPI003D169A86